MGSITTASQSLARKAHSVSPPPFPPTFCSSFFYVQRICTLNHQRSFVKNTPFKVFSSLVNVEDDVNEEACESVNGVVACYGVWGRRVDLKSRQQYWAGVRCLCSPTDQKLRLAEEIEVSEKGEVLDWLVSEYGWRVRRLVEEADEMKEVAFIQAQAFHVPLALFDDYFFEFFKAEVLAGLIYKLKNSPPDRYACLVAESSSDTPTAPEGLVGIVDVTALRDKDVLRHLQGADEYLYISGLAVLKSFRRQRIATVLLQACEALSILYGFQYLALRAYEDDVAAQKLYTNAGYRIVEGDPPWFSTWIGRRRRVVMIKRSGSSEMSK